MFYINVQILFFTADLNVIPAKAGIYSETISSAYANDIYSRQNVFDSPCLLKQHTESIRPSIF